MSRFLSPGQPLVTLHADDPLATVVEKLSNVPYPVLPVIDGDGRLLGVVDLEEVHLASQEPSLQRLVLAADLMQSGIRPLTPDNTLDRALELFVENDLLALPVVSDITTGKVVGVVRRFDIATLFASCAWAAGNVAQPNEGRKAGFQTSQALWLRNQPCSIHADRTCAACTACGSPCT